MEKWVETVIVIVKAGFNMHIRRSFGRSKQSTPGMPVFLSSKGIITIIGTIYEKDVIDLTHHRSRFASKKRKKEKEMIVKPLKLLMHKANIYCSLLSVL
jgi:hypothetical protein